MGVNLLIVVIILFSLVIVSLLIYQLLKLRKRIKKLQFLYKDIIDYDEEIKSKRSEMANEEIVHKIGISHIDSKIITLKKKYNEALSVYDDLLKQNNLLQDNLDLADFGIYEPHFDLEMSELFKNKTIETKTEQKNMIKSKSAILGGKN